MPTGLAQAGCAANVKFCGTLKVDESATPVVFAAVGKNANSIEVADGCAKQVINQDQVTFSIAMQRNTPPSVCGNNMIDPTEQCDPAGGPGDAVCDSMCHTKEEYLSAPSTMAGSTLAGMPGDKTFAKVIWPAGAGALGRLVGIWEDHADPRTMMNLHLSMRLMDNALFPLKPSDFNQEASTASFFIPNDSSATTFPPTPDSFDQGAPAIVLVGSKYYVVFEDDDNTPGAPLGHVFDIHMRTMDSTTYKADQPVDTPIGINGANGVGEVLPQVSPAVAVGPNNNLLITWLDVQAAVNEPGMTCTPPLCPPGQVFGVVYDTTQMKVVGNKTPISNGPSDLAPSVAGTPTGWVVTWASGSDIRYRVIAADGSATAPDQKVNDAQHSGRQDHPQVASLPDGSFAIVWADHGAQGNTDIVYQRFDSAGMAIAGDQAVAFNTTTMGEQVNPAVAAAGANGGVFAAAWADVPSGQIRARLFSMSSGFLFNNVDGSDHDFQASVADGHSRDNPALAMGGSGFLAIAWEDKFATQPGIYARRFPMPQP
jgi:hypothetical protein